MTDRELIELAAKAAGIELDWNIPPNSRTPWRMTGTKGTDDYGPASGWNPITDDGDALRLAVKLAMEIDTGYSDRFVLARTPGGVWFESVIVGSAEIATRRAIVLAAAEIGKTA